MAAENAVKNRTELLAEGPHENEGSFFACSTAGN